MTAISRLIAEQDLIRWAAESDQAAQFITERAYIPEADLNITIEGPGVISLVPVNEQRRAVILSSAIHGNETAPIELCEQLFSDIVSGNIVLECRLLLIIGNLNAMREGTRFCDENLNRLFKDSAPTHSNKEVHRAELLKGHVQAFFQQDDSERIHFDLHTAIRDSKYPKFAIYPYLADGNWQQAYLQWLTNADIEAILLANKVSGTFSCYTSLHFNAHAFTIELGKARPFGMNDHNTLSRFKSALKDLLSNHEAMVHQPTPQAPRVFKVVAEVLRHQEQFNLNLSKDFANFTGLENGYQLTEDGDNSYVINGEHQAIVFPNDQVPIGQRVALVIEPR